MALCQLWLPPLISALPTQSLVSALSIKTKRLQRGLVFETQQILRMIFTEQDGYFEPHDVVVADKLL